MLPSIDRERLDRMVPSEVRDRLPEPVRSLLADDDAPVTPVP